MGGLSVRSVFGQASLSVNDIIVLITIFLFLIVILACSIMWATRPQPLARKEVPDQITSQRNRPDSQLTHSNSGISKANSSDKSKSSRDKKKSKKRDRGTSIDLEAGKRSSPLSSLHSIEAESFTGGHVSAETDNVAATTTQQSEADSVLAQTLLSVLSQGMTLKIYNEKGAKQANVTLVGGCELHWKTIRIFSKKGKQLNLREVLFVNGGKQTKKFHLPGSKNAVDDHCFSLVTSQYSLDFEASSKVERDALVQGFTILMTRFREKMPVEEIKWGAKKV